MVDKSSLPKGASSVVDMRDFTGDGELTLIHGYGGGGFRIAKQPYQGDQILLPRTRFDWQAPAWDKISIDDLAPIFIEPLPPLLIMGLGEAPQGLLPELQVALSQKASQWKSCQRLQLAEHGMCFYQRDVTPHWHYWRLIKDECTLSRAA